MLRFKVSFQVQVQVQFEGEDIGSSSEFIIRVRLNYDVQAQ